MYIEAEIADATKILLSYVTAMVGLGYVVVISLDTIVREGLPALVFQSHPEIRR
jgi:hypothetical protein